MSLHSVVRRRRATASEVALAQDDALDQRKSHRPVGVVAIVVGVVLASIGLRQLVPAFVIGDASFDDLLAVKGGDSLHDHHWLGPFNANVTLAKGIGYPYFLAMCQRFHIPVLLAQQVLHVAAAGVVAAVVWRLTRSRNFALTLFAVLALDPSYLGPQSSRLIRDNWYSSISLLLFGLISSILLLPRIRQSRMSGRIWVAIILQGLVAGALLGLYWVGREERPWLFPSLMALSLAALILRRRDSEDGGAHPPLWRRTWVARVTAVLAMGAVFVSIVQAVAAKNERAYGAHLTNDVTEGAFPKLFGAWQAVEAGTSRQYVPINRQQRLAVYAISPSARELEKFIEGPETQYLVDAGCRSQRVCNDIAGGWTQWAIRQAVALTGHYRDASQVQALYRQITSDILRACRTHQISCGLVMPSLLPEPSQIRIGAFIKSLGLSFRSLIRFHLAKPQPGLRSVASPQNWQIFADSVPGLPATLAEQNRREAGYDGHNFVVIALAHGYAALTTLLFIVAVVGFVLAPLRRRQGWLAPWLLAGAVAVAVIGRLALLAVVDSTSFAAADTVYVLPASALLLTFVALGCWLLVNADRARPAMHPERSQTSAPATRRLGVEVRGQP